MATSGRGSGVVGYNVQVATETEHHLIIAHEVTNVGSDRSQLANTAKAAKEVLQVDKLEAVADRGYYHGEEIKACADAGITVTLPKPLTSGAKSEGRFGKQDFAYLADEDVYRCPAGEKLRYYYTNEENGQKLRNYGRMRAGTAHSNHDAHRRRRAGSSVGSMSTFSRKLRSGSTATRTRCAPGARSSNIHSAPSRCAWARRTS